MSYISTSPSSISPAVTFSRFGARPRPSLPEAAPPQSANARSSAKKIAEVSREALFASLIGTEITIDRFKEIKARRDLVYSQTEAQADALDRYGERCRKSIVDSLVDVATAFDVGSSVRSILDALACDLSTRYCRRGMAARGMCGGASPT